MKLNKVVMVVVLIVVLSLMFVFVDMMNGQIEFQGELVNIVCGLVSGLSLVSVDFG